MLTAINDLTLNIYVGQIRQKLGMPCLLLWDLCFYF